MEARIMARLTALSRRFGILFMGLMLTLGVIGAQSVGAANTGNYPPVIQQPGSGQPGICLPCFWGITNLQQKTLFHASNFPNKSMVQVTFDFVGDETSVMYAIQPANAPNPPTPGEYWHAQLQASGHYEDDQYLTKGGHYRFYVTVVDTYGTSYSKVLDFWTA
jgi:hypothetical protein